MAKETKDYEIPVGRILGMLAVLMVIEMVAVALSTLTSKGQTPPVPQAEYLLSLPFNEGEGDIAHDTSGHGHDAALHDVMWTTQGLYFNGPGSYAEVVDTPELNPIVDFSIEAYIKPMFTGQMGAITQGPIAMKGDNWSVAKPDRRGWLLLGRQGSVLFLPLNTPYSETYFASIEIPAELSHIKFEVLPSISEVRGYVNGELQTATKINMTKMASPGIPLYLGTNPGIGDYSYYGLISEFKMRLV